MLSSNINPKLAAIMFTDIAGYTKQMSKDEDKDLAKKFLSYPIPKAIIKAYN